MDPAYEYDAPTYIDFETVKLGLESDDGVDCWFDQEGLLEDDTTADPATSRAFSDNFASVMEEVEQEPSNAVVVKTEEPSPSEHMKRDGEGAGGCEKGSNKQKKSRLGKKRSAAIASLITPTVKQRRVQRGAAIKASALMRNTLSHSKTQHHLLTSSEHHSVTAKTPEHMRRYLAKKQSKQVRTKEELEKEEREKMQEEIRKQLQQNRRSFRRLAKTSKPQPVRHSKPTTEPVGFNFRTDKRCRRKTASRPPSASNTNASAFPMLLRSGREVLAEIPPKPKKVKPFNFRLNSRLPLKTREEQHSKSFVSSAEYIHKLETETPERFWTSQRKKRHTLLHPQPKECFRRGNTVPVTPKLQTKTRSRPVTVKSSAELEEEELAKIKEKSFKSHPVNPKVFTNSWISGVPIRISRPLTQPHTPKLATDLRIKAKKDMDHDVVDEARDKVVVFKAQPLPMGMFEKVKGVPEKRPHPLTCPQSPALELKRRHLHHPHPDKDQEPSHEVCAQPMPDFSHVFKPQLSGKLTEPEPFTFLERDKDKPTRGTLIQQILQRDGKPQFKANPLPEFRTPRLPEKMVKPATRATTPNLRTKARGEEYCSKWKQQLEEVVQKEKEEAEFTASSAAVLYKVPFIPAKTEHPMAEVSNIVLRSEIRSEQRAKFDAERQEKEQQRELENQERRVMTEAQEAKELTLLRRSLVHRAQKTKQYASVSIKNSTQPLTIPASPKFILPRRGLL